jgi:hypothetical protein
MLVKTWSMNVLGMGLDCQDYVIVREAYESSLKKNVFDFYNSLKRENPSMIKIGISQSFSLGEPMMKEILGLDYYISNQFFCEEGKITSSSLNVIEGDDKLNFAKRIISDAILKGKISSKYSLGLILDCYDDVQLIRLDNVSLLLYKKKIERFVRNSKAKLKVIYS